MIKNYYAFFQINCGLPTVFNFLVRWTCPAYWVDFSTVTSGLPLAEYSSNCIRNCNYFFIFKCWFDMKSIMNSFFKFI